MGTHPHARPGQSDSLPGDWGTGVGTGPEIQVRILNPKGHVRAA